MMKTFDKIMWAAVALLSLVALVAVVFFGWEPSNQNLAATAFFGLAAAARARFLLVDIEYK
jgi:hypothetical protein